MAVIGGRDAAFAYANGDGITTAEGLRWRARFSRSRTNITPLGYVMDRFWFSRLRIEGWVDIQATDSAAEPLPTGTVGDLTLTTSSGKTYTAKAALEAMDTGADSPTDAPQTVRYAFVGTATGSSDAIARNG